MRRVNQLVEKDVGGKGPKQRVVGQHGAGQRRDGRHGAYALPTYFRGSPRARAAAGSLERISALLNRSSRANW